MSPDQAFTLVDTEQSVAARFEHQVRNHGARAAVVDGDRTWTYDELNRQANRIARAMLRLTGLAPTRVAIYLDKGANYLACILAVLKAGHAYVPLDPAFPRARNRSILDDVRAPLVLSHSSRVAEAAELAGGLASVLNLDELSTEPGAERNLGLHIAPDALAYIIYTSGSTGRPKGVMQNQRNLLHGCMRRSRLQGIVPEDRMSLFYSCSVMGSVYCIFGALLNGAALLPYDIREAGLVDLAPWLVQQRLTVYHSVASVFRQFAGQLDGVLSGSSVRLVIFGGERVFVSDIAMARRVFSPDVLFFTGLGSTETGTIRHLMITPQTALSERLVPIGYPVEGVEVLLKSDDGQVLGPGQVGEIHVRSRYVALGYWNDVSATRRAFGSVDAAQGIREYRMGDLAELMPDGRLEHRGRKDFQVKIRGFRVETGEIDAALQSHPALLEASVSAQELDGELQLVAYLVLRKAQAVNARQLREHLRSQLPGHMMPSAFVELAKLPRTPNGKILVSALPLPSPHNRLADVPMIPPSTTTQSQLLAICAAVLGRPVSGVNVNFFDVGGDSLSATRLLSRIDQCFATRISMRAIFSADSLAALAATIDRIRANRSAGSEGLDRGLVPTDRTTAPATAAQQRLWLAAQLNPGSAAYNISNAVRLRGDLDVRALERALDEVLRRHGSLRTCFQLQGHQLVQIENPATLFTLAMTDLGATAAEAREQQVESWVRHLAAQAFDLARGRVFDAQLLCVGPNDHVLSLNFSHIVYDNIWSSQVLFRELGELYASHCDDAKVQLAAPRLRFLDYARWEHQRAASADLSKPLRYWRNHLQAMPAPLELPSDRARPRHLSGHGGQIAFEVPASVRVALQRLNRQHNTTSFMSLLAVWQLLLHRHSGQNDVVVGTPTGRRYRPETEDMVGLFINNLVMRTRFDEGMSFSDLLGRVRKLALDAFEHDTLPFETLVSELAPARDGGGAPFFRHFFIHRNATQSVWALPGLDVQSVSAHPGTSKFDLTLSVLEKQASLSGTLEYSTDLFDPATAERMVGHYLALLTAAVASPDVAVAALNMLSEEEHRQLVELPNRTSQAMPYGLGVLGLFDQQVKAQPDEMAVVAHDGRLTYAQLNASAHRLAVQLIAHGLGCDDLVGVCLDRSARLPVALLAVLMAGAAYVPLDPDYPAERLQGMLEDSQAKVLISETAVLGRLQGIHAAQVLALDELPETDLPSSVAALPASDPDDLAYVIYTSGSTGKPKGVQVTHRGLTNFMCSMRAEPGLARTDVLHAVTTVCFDIAGLELFLPLVTGARVVIGPRELSLSPDALCRSLHEHQATVMQATPVTWRMLLDNGWKGAPGFKVLCGGEAMGADLAERLLATGCEVWNLYGPTETTIWSSVGRVQSKDDARYVGRAIANTELLVTNSALAVQPVNVPGELLIGGAGLARGYFGRADLSAERFVQSALGSTGRLYRTGDVAVRRADGAIEFFGRADHQVKIRGFRVELGDIEAHLASHPGVRQAVVIARDDGVGGKCLVAYVVLQEAALMPVQELHAHLKTVLPHYMLPSAFVSLPAFPLTPNGKIDRARLPAPGSVPAQPMTDRQRSEPRDDLDRSFLSVFESILQRPGLGIDDDFFSNGGDSMLAVRLVNELRLATGLEYPLSTVFEAPSIRQLIAAAGDRAERAASVVRLNDAAEGTPIYCLAGVQLYRALAKRLPRHPVHGVYARREWVGPQPADRGSVAKVPLEELVQSYADAVERHSSQRTIALAGLSFGGLMALEVATELTRRGFTVPQVIMFDTLPSCAYTRSLGKGLADLARLCTQGGFLRTARDWVQRRSAGRRSDVIDPADSDGAMAPTPEAQVTRAHSYKDWAKQFKLQDKHYRLNVLLIKATQKSLGLGVALKTDYGFGRVIGGRLTLAEVDADHLGVLEPAALDAVVGCLQPVLASPAEQARPTSSTTVRPDTEPHLLGV